MNADNDALSNFECPRCSSKYPIGPIFDHDPNICSGCGSKLIEWNLIEHIYLIDYENAPGIIKKIIEYLEDENEHDAYVEVKHIIGLLCFKEKS
ncbi:MAG: hypothetical protein OEZ25_08480 [Candidatus Bathyarchaeota archaeon]|nr:hypothetical protein [Candidatus Bathyarchaeota archaeon]